MSDEFSEAAVVAQLAQGAVAPVELDTSKLYHVGRMDGGVVDLEHLQAEPRRTKGVYRPADFASLVAYAKLHDEAMSTTAWVDRDLPGATFVFNDAASSSATGTGETLPGWLDHRAVLELRRTPEWLHWLSRDGEWLGQEDFAEHLQDGSVEIVKPDAATMLEVAQSIEGSTNANWMNARRLDNGQVGFSYEETTTATAGQKKNIEIPAEFELKVAPFYGEEPQGIMARLRYRVRNGQLLIGYKLIRPQQIEEDTFAGLADRLTKEGFGQVYKGVAPVR